MEDGNHYFTRAELAEVLGITTTTLKEWEAAGYTAIWPDQYLGDAYCTAVWRLKRVKPILNAIKKGNVQKLSMVESIRRLSQ